MDKMKNPDVMPTPLVISLPPLFQTGLQEGLLMRCSEGACG
jgi:hypothetical protein